MSGVPCSLTSSYVDGVGGDLASLALRSWRSGAVVTALVESSVSLVADSED